LQIEPGYPQPAERERATVGGRGQAWLMFTPGQLIRHQRLRRGWTQGELAEATGLTQGSVSRYEGDALSPSWTTLCRLLGAMGMQPRVVAEPCDISQHEVSAWARSDLEERLTGTAAALNDEEIDLPALLSPQVSEAPIRLYHLLPLLELLRGFEFVLVGRIALRMHGLGCSVPRVDVLVQGEPGPDLWRHLCERLDTGTIALWSPEVERYRWRPEESVVASVAALVTWSDPPRTELSLRTRDTATEIRLQIRPGELPPHVMGGTMENPVPLLAIGELVASGGPEVGEAFRRIHR
jgi:transcriptional regulator with XRE-family HTH domain